MSCFTFLLIQSSNGYIVWMWSDVEYDIHKTHGSYMKSRQGSFQPGLQSSKPIRLALFQLSTIPILHVKECSFLPAFMNVSPTLLLAWQNIGVYIYIYYILVYIFWGWSLNCHFHWFCIKDIMAWLLHLLSYLCSFVREMKREKI